MEKLNKIGRKRLILGLTFGFVLVLTFYFGFHYFLLTDSKFRSLMDTDFLESATEEERVNYTLRKYWSPFYFKSKVEFENIKMSHSFKWFSNIFLKNDTVCCFDGESLFEVDSREIVLYRINDAQITNMVRLTLGAENKLLGIQKNGKQFAVLIEEKPRWRKIVLPKEFANAEENILVPSMQGEKIAVLHGKNIWFKDGPNWISRTLKGYSCHQFVPDHLGVPKRFKPPLDILICGNSAYLSYNTGESGALSIYDLKTGKESFIYVGDPVTSMILDKSGDLWFISSLAYHGDLKSGLHKFQGGKLTLVSTHTGVWEDDVPHNKIGWRKTSASNWNFDTAEFLKIKLDSDNKLILVTDDAGVFRISGNEISRIKQPCTKSEEFLDFTLDKNGELFVLKRNGIERIIAKK